MPAAHTAEKRRIKLCMSGPVLLDPRLEMSMTTQDKHSSKYVNTYVLCWVLHRAGKMWNCGGTFHQRFMKLRVFPLWIDWEPVNLKRVGTTAVGHRFQMFSMGRRFASLCLYTPPIHQPGNMTSERKTQKCSCFQF